MSRLHAEILAQLLVFAWPVCTAAQPAPVQKPAEQFKIGVEVNMVTVPVTVRGPRGKFLKDLPQSAFRIMEDGREQEIVTFAREGVPLRLAFVLDTSSSVNSEWSDIADSTQKFVQQLKPADKMALLTFNDQIHLHLNWGHHGDKIGGVLSSITCTGRTALWDAVWMVSKDLFRGVRERKAIVLMTDGLDNASATKFEKMLDASIRSEAAIYIVSKTEAVRQQTLQNKNLWPKEFVEADLALQKLADETGGRVLYLEPHLHPTDQLDTAYREVYEELQSQYTIGYISNNKPVEGTYRRIQVLVDHPDVEVSARRGYFPDGTSEGLEQITSIEPVNIPAPVVEKRRPQVPAALERSTHIEGFKLGIEVNLVTVPITVRGPDGTFLKGLLREAFRIQEDGYEQEIVSFTQEDVPVHVALVLDTSSSVRTEWGAIKQTAEKFASLLHPEDRFALVTFNDQTRLRIDWGNRTERLEPVLGSIYCRGTTNLWDALWLVGNEVFKGVQGKKAVIVISDGLDNGSFVSHEEMRDAAVRSEAMFYVVSKTAVVRDAMLREMERRGDYPELPWQPFAGAERNLLALAEETGGRLLRPDNFGQIGGVYEEIFDELRNQYTIGYISKNPPRNGGYRRIQVLVDRPGAKAYARAGYLPQDPLVRMTSNSSRDAVDKASSTTLKHGTPVFLRLVETVTSKRQAGGIARLEVFKDVKAGDLTVLAKGAYAWATIDSGTHAPRFLGIGGNVTLDVNGAHAVTGHRIGLRGSSAQHGEDLEFSPLAFLMKGSHAVIPKGTSVLAYVDADLSLNTDLLRKINSNPPVTRSHEPTGASERALVHIYGRGYQLGMLRPSVNFGGSSYEMLGKPSVFLDGGEVARISENHFLTFEISVGKHNFKTDRNQVEVNLLEGQEIYLRVTTKGNFWPKGHIEVATLAEGEAEMYPLAPVDAKDIRAPLAQWSRQVGLTVR